MSPMQTVVRNNCLSHSTLLNIVTNSLLKRKIATKAMNPTIFSIAEPANLNYKGAILRKLNLKHTPW